MWLYTGNKEDSIAFEQTGWAWNFLLPSLLLIPSGLLRGYL